MVRISVKRLSRSQSHSAAERIMSIKNYIDAIGNRPRDLPACSAVPQPTALPSASTSIECLSFLFSDFSSNLPTYTDGRTACTPQNEQQQLIVSKARAATTLHVYAVLVLVT